MAAFLVARNADLCFENVKMVVVDTVSNFLAEKIYGLGSALL
jgi:hypothetical protein